MFNPSYPNLGLWSKTDLAKRISGPGLTLEDAISLIDEVLTNHDALWNDHKKASEPLKNKYVRNASGTNLGRLLKLIDRKVLAPHDKLVPGFIFGGLKGKSHVQAARYVQGTKLQRTYRTLDVSNFFEQISEQRIFYFLYKKARCSLEVAQIISKICSTPVGPKGSTEQRVLARGFATSSRLALWCNLSTFNRIHWRMKRMLKGHEPRMAIYVDDIGFSASRVSIERIETVSKEIESLLSSFDPNQPLPLNAKSKTSRYDARPQHLGILMGRKLSFGDKSKGKAQGLANKMNKLEEGFEKKILRRRLKAYDIYRTQLNKASFKKNRQ